MSESVREKRGEIFYYWVWWWIHSIDLTGHGEKEEVGEIPRQGGKGLKKEQYFHHQKHDADDDDSYDDNGGRDPSGIA